jgi:multidrug efflux pump
MVMGAVPLVIASGVGSNSRHQIGWVIIAGLMLGTFFSLFVVPVAYSLLAKLKWN